jgi:hypothetical protein
MRPEARHERRRRSIVSPAVVCRIVVVAAAAWPGATDAQASRTLDSVFLRAERTVARGEGAAGRLLMDSVLASLPRNTPSYGAALYWRGRLAATRADAERFHRRVIIEYPSVPQAGAALVALADLAQANGDRDRAASYLDRLLGDHPGHAERGRAALRLATLRFEANDPVRGCAALNAARASTPTSAVEQRNQIEFSLRRCVGVDASPSAAGGGDSLGGRGVASPPARDSLTGRDTSPALRPDSGAAPARFTVQAGAFQTRAEADRTATRLRGQGHEARVVGAARPFRVLVGRFATRAGADSLSRLLTTRGVANFVTTLPDGPPRHP